MTSLWHLAAAVVKLLILPKSLIDCCGFKKKNLRPIRMHACCTTVLTRTQYTLRYTGGGVVVRATIVPFPVL